MSTDPFPARLLDDYLDRIRKKNPESLVATVISTRSREARRLLAHLVAEPPATLEDVLAAARDEASERAFVDDHRIDGEHLAKLGRALVCTPLDEDDRETGHRLYDMALRHGGPDSIAERDQSTHAELALLSGKTDEARQLLDGYGAVDPHVRRAIEGRSSPSRCRSPRPTPKGPCSTGWTPRTCPRSTRPISCRSSSRPTGAGCPC
jgi:hypothetical protein